MILRNRMPAIQQPLARSCRRYFRIAAFRDAARNTRRIRRQICDECRTKSARWSMPHLADYYVTELACGVSKAF
jgi:hypothetical protein